MLIKIKELTTSNLFLRLFKSCARNDQFTIVENNRIDFLDDNLKLSDKKCFKSILQENNARSFKDIPGPKSYFLFGNTWRFFPVIGNYYKYMNDAYGFLKDLNDNFGDIIRMENIVGMGRAVILFNPEDIEMIYKLEALSPERDILPSMSYFRKHFRQDVFKNAKGLLTSHGNEWYTFRNKVNTIMMQPKIVKQYVEPIDRIGRELIEKIRRNRDVNNRIQLDFLEEINKWSLESIAYIAINSKLNCLANALPEDSLSLQLIRNTQEIFEFSSKLDFSPNIWKYISTPTYKKVMKLYHKQVILCQTLINTARKRIQEKKIANNAYSKSASEISVLEKLLTIDENVAIVMTLDMLVAGVDTTSTSLINILYYLALNPSKQNLLRQEISSILSNNQTSLSINDLNRMPYLKACIKEAARLYPATLGTMRILTKDTTISGYRVPKGVVALFPHVYLSLMEKHYPKPFEYIPERWLRDQRSSELSYKNAHPFCFLHFGYGTRSCIGRRFAELELEIAVIHFIKNFEITWQGPPPRYVTKCVNYLVQPFGFVFSDAK